MRVLALLACLSCTAEVRRQARPDDEVLIEQDRRRTRARAEVFPPCVGPEALTARDAATANAIPHGAAVVLRGSLTLSEGACTLAECVGLPPLRGSRADVERLLRGPCCNSCTAAARLGPLAVAVRGLPLAVEAFDCAMPRVREDLAAVEVVVWGELRRVTLGDGREQLLVESDRICASALPPLEAPAVPSTAPEFVSVAAAALAVAEERQGSEREKFLARAIPALFREKEDAAVLTASTRLLEAFPASPHAAMARFWRDAATARLPPRAGSDAPAP